MATKRTVTKIWLWGAAVMAFGGVAILAGSLALVAHVSNVTHDNQLKFTPDDFFWVTIFFIVLGSIIAGGGLITQFVAHRGAEINTRQLSDKTWFRKLRRGGIAAAVIAFLTLIGMVVGAVLNWGGTQAAVWIGFPLAVIIEWAVMLSYLIGGPDGSAIRQPQVRPSQPPEMTLAAKGDAA